MDIFFADETLIHGKGGEEYGLSIYGGLILDEKSIKDLTSFLYKLKTGYAFPQELELKWRFESVWDNMKHVKFIKNDFTKVTKPKLYENLKSDYEQLKTRVLEEISNSTAKIIVAIRPNKLLNASKEKNTEYSISAVTRKFRKVLNNENKMGIILADELPKRLSKIDDIDYQYILNLCCYDSTDGLNGDGLLLIIPTIDSCISPIHQINDILLGAIQYYILEFMRKIKNDNLDIDKAKAIFNKIRGKFYKTERGGYIINNGILLYPPRNSRLQTKAGIFLDKLEDQLKIDFGIY